MHKMTITCSFDGLYYDTVNCYSMLYIISKTIDYLHQLCFIYKLNYPVIYSLSECESGCKHARNYVYLLQNRK